MSTDNAGMIAVIDFRRQGMILQWHASGGTWNAYDMPPALVHGVALIRAGHPNICMYAQAGRLRLQVGPEQYELAANTPRIRCSRGLASFGLWRRFRVESSTGETLFTHAYWTGQGDDFFRWLAVRAQDPGWRETAARTWSDGLPASTLRSSSVLRAG